MYSFVLVRGFQAGVKLEKLPKLVCSSYKFLLPSVFQVLRTYDSERVKNSKKSVNAYLVPTEQIICCTRKSSLEQMAADEVFGVPDTSSSPRNECTLG